MKKIFQILFTFALLLGAVSCTDLLDEALRGRGAIPGGDAAISEFPEGARLTLGFNVPMPIATKAMTEDPEINSIHVFVFVDNGVSKNGVLFEVQKATLGGLVHANAIKNESGTITNPDEALARWEVSLLMSRTKRRLHFVANLPEDFEIPEAGSAEFSVMRSIQTAGDEVAYWQMVELENGVLAYTYDGSGKFSYVGSDGTKVEQSVTAAGIEGWQSYDSATGTYHYKDGDDVIDVAKGDYIATTGHKILDGKGFYASEELSDAVSMIPLIRNFARINVIASAGTGHNFRLDSAVLINVPGSGYVAPFDDHNNQFVEAYRKAGSTALSHDVILNAGYPASIPPDTIVTKCPTKAVKATTVNNRDTVLLYMYERGIPTQSPTSLLVKGSIANGEKRWFKIEIADEDGSYFPIYRDFTYEVEIKSITGSEGYDSMEDAYNAPAIGDISSSKETETLTQIDDGKGLVLWVEYIDYTSPLNEAGEKGFLYKFYDTSGNYSDQVTLTIVPVEGREAAINTTAESLSGESYDGVGPDGQNGWYQAMVPLAAPGDETKISTLHVSGTKAGGKTLYRNVTFRVMKKQDFTLSATPLASENAGEATTLSVTLPQYLGYSVFPLTLMIEAQAGNLNPGDSENLSVESGPSLFGTGKNSFYFLKTISYSEYQASRTYPIVFKTTVNGEETALGTNVTTIAVKDKNGYFNTGTTFVSAPPVLRLKSASTSVSASTTQVTLQVISTGDGTWTLTANNNATLSYGTQSNATITGTGNATVTMTIPANTGTTAVPYTVTASLDGFENQECTITQKAAWVTVTRDFSINRNTVARNGDNVSYSGDYDSEIGLVFNGVSDYNHGSATRFSRNCDFTLSAKEGTSKSISQIVITFTSDDYRATTVTSTPNASSNTGTTTRTITYNNPADEVTLELSRNNNNTIRISQISITYLYHEE